MDGVTPRTRQSLAVCRPYHCHSVPRCACGQGEGGGAMHSAAPGGTCDMPDQGVHTLIAHAVLPTPHGRCSIGRRGAQRTTGKPPIPRPPPRWWMPRPPLWLRRAQPCHASAALPHLDGSDGVVHVIAHALQAGQGRAGQVAAGGSRWGHQRSPAGRARARAPALSIAAPGARNLPTRCGVSHAREASRRRRSSRLSITDRAPVPQP